MRQDGSNHLDFIAEAFREKRADRAVNQARRQRFELRRPAFTLEETTRDLAGGEGLFLIVYRQWEEILTWLGGTRTNSGAEHNSVTQAGHYSTIGLTGDFAAFQNQGLVAPGDFLAEVIFEHRHPLGRWPMPARTTPSPPLGDSAAEGAWWPRNATQRVKTGKRRGYSVAGPFYRRLGRHGVGPSRKGATGRPPMWPETPRWSLSEATT